MHFRYLTEIGHQYQTEVGTSGASKNPIVWASMSRQYKQSLLDKQAHANDPIKLNAINLKIAKLRKWAEAEGVTINDNGEIPSDNIAPRTVIYDNSADARKLTRVEIVGGKLHKGDSAGRTGTDQLLDTTEMVTHFSGPGYAIYVMSPTGTLHVASHIVGGYHHSSLLAGANVAAAGEMSVRQGMIQLLSNKSGHYQPDPTHLLQVLHQLQKSKVSMDFALKVFEGSKPAARFSKVQHYLDSLNPDDQNDYELDKLFAYSAHLNDNVLAQRGWRWRDADKGEPAAVHTISSGLPVPHKVVRSWLKINGYTASDSLKSGAHR